MSRGHSVNCADAVRTTPDECECKCRGRFHGGPHTERVRALVWDENKMEQYSRRQVTRAKRSAREALAAGNSVGETCTDFAVTHTIDTLIAVSSSEQQEIARETLSAILGPFVTVVAKADLDTNASKYIETAVNSLHIVCTLCVETLKLLDQLNRGVKIIAGDLANKVVEQLGDQPFLTKVVRQVLTEALTRSFESVVTLTADPLKLKMLQLMGFATCPNVTEHRDVESHCIKPLANEYVTSALLEWIDCDFPEDSIVMHRAARRNKST